ncbi:zinc finger protein 679-like isoform X14 [Monodelphis domestica]|uniref:zinc finger protein 679-like isoform X14 n=1 Tax=Monodelphis domestica TaxID=13616 RepID=UPI0024E230DD|nr:zinc finger protein 679-like isoform X14 [Monodelphis domestica]
MAPRTPRSPSQGSITLKDVTVDFTQEEWVLLDHSQQGLYLEVMLENVQNLHSVGLLVPREKFISCFQQRETPCLLEQECPRSPYPGIFRRRGGWQQLAERLGILLWQQLSSGFGKYMEHYLQ